MKPRTRRTATNVPRAWAPPLRFESLESRALLSVQPAGAEFQVNSYTQGDQSFGNAANYAAASDADGDRIVAWSSLGQDGDSWGVFAQRYAADGAPLGAEFRVNSTTAGAQLDPAVAIDPDGDFVIAWASANQDGAGYGIFAQRFDATGAKRGNEFRVNATTAGDQTSPAVAMDAAGDFVVVWNSAHDGDLRGIHARLYREDGAALSGEIQVNATTAGDQHDPVVARTLAGDIVVAWASAGQDGDADGIVARRVDRHSAPLGDEILVNQFTAGAQNRPALAARPDGAFLVAWESAAQDGDGQGIVVRQFHADGSPVSDEAVANAITAGNQSQPALALSAAADYLLAWTSQGQDGDGAGVYVRTFAADGTPGDDEVMVNTTTASDQERPTIAVDDRGHFVVAWQSAGQDGDGLGVFAQRFQSDALDTAAPLVGGVYQPGDTHRLRAGERLLAATSSLVVTFSEAMSAADGPAGASSALNPANYRLTLFGADYSSQILSVAYSFNETTHRYAATIHFAAPLPRGAYTLRVEPSVADVHGNLLDGDLDGLPGGAFAIEFEVAEMIAAGAETAVNTETAGDQAYTAGAPGTIAMDHAGNYVITWASVNQDGSGWGIYAQRFSAAGEKLGGEFRVNSHVTSHQRFSTVAMDADGDFVITWSSLNQDGGNYGVYAQRFAADGTAVGGEFRVNTVTVKFQGRSTVAMDDDGDFVVAWESTDQDGSGVGIYYQLFHADGTRRGGETRANTITASHQRLPHVAMDSDGDFVITWSGPPDGSGYGIFARRFNAAGVGQGPEFLANTLTAGNQQNSTVAMDDDGDFVVAWHSSTGDGVFYGVYAQRFTAQGEKFGDQFLVNTFTANFQQFPSVAVDANGDFVVAWQSLTQDDSVWGVYGQRYSWGGGRVGEEFQIHTTTHESQNAPSVAMSTNGDFVVTWQSLGQDGGGWGIYSQRYSGQINHAPEATIAGPFEISEGEGLSLEAGGTDADVGQALTFFWDLNNDGLFRDAIGATPSLTHAELAALGLQDDGHYAIAVRVVDGYGGVHVATSTLTIVNAAPGGLVLNPLTSAAEGAEMLLTGVFADAGAADLHTLSIDWGDGRIEEFAVAAGDRSFQVAHTYRDNAPEAYRIRVKVADDDGGDSGEVETTLIVRNVAPSIENLQFSKIVLNEGEEFTVSGHVVDPGLDDTHSITFEWSDGRLETIDVDPVTRQFSISYAYRDDDPSGTDLDLVHFDFTIADNDLGAAVIHAAVTVRNVAPLVVDVQQSASAIDEAGSVTFTGRLEDVGVDDVLSLEVDWGDGSVEIVAVDPVTRTFSATHVYVDDDPTGTPSDVYTVTFHASDDDLGASQAEATVTVNNVAPTASIDVSPARPFGRREITLQALVADAGLNDTFSIGWEVYRGPELIATGSEVVLRFTPIEPGEYTFHLQVADDDGGGVTVQESVDICMLPGDSNGDCIVDLSDLNLVRNYFGASRNDEEWQNYAGPLPGDVTFDDLVGLDDLNLVRNHFGEIAASLSPMPLASSSMAVAPSPEVRAAGGPHRQAVDAVFAGFVAGERTAALPRRKQPR